MGWASGMRAGIAIGEAFNKGRQERAYEDIQSQKAEGLQGYTAADGAKLEELANSGLYDIVPQYGEVTPALRAQNPEATQGAFTGYRAVPKADIAARAQDPQNRQYSGLAPRDINPNQVTDFLGQRYAGDLPEARQVGLRSRALAEATVDPIERQRLLSAAIKEDRDAILAQREDELYPIQLRQAELGVESSQLGLTRDQLSIDAAQRTQQLNETYDTGMEKIMSTTYEKPEERTNAVLSLLEQTKGPEVAAQLRANYTTTELNNLSLQAKKFDEGFRQARSKGVGQALDWFDEQNTSFKLERDKKNPFKIYQIDEKTGAKSVFADAKSERELGMFIDAKAKPGGWLELAKFEQDKATSDSQRLYYESLRKNVGIPDIEKKVAAYEKATGRKATPSELNRLFGLEAKETGKMSDLQKANLEYYRKMTEPGGPWAKKSQGELDREAADLGIYGLLKPGSQTAAGLGGWGDGGDGGDGADTGLSNFREPPAFVMPARVEPQPPIAGSTAALRQQPSTAPTPTMLEVRARNAAKAQLEGNEQYQQLRQAALQYIKPARQGDKDASAMLDRINARLREVKDATTQRILSQQQGLK